MKHLRLNQIILIIFTLPFFNQQGNASDSDTIFPRLEIYTSNQGFINRAIYPINDIQLEELLQTPINFITDFQENKQSITLEHYFKVSKLTNSYTKRKLFPYTLNGYRSLLSDTISQSIINYRNQTPKTIEIIWLNKDTWFVNSIFYTINIDELVKKINDSIVENQLSINTINGFMDYSYVIQEKLSEGNLSLSMNQNSMPFNSKMVMVNIALTPGMPNTSHYDYSIYYDGRVQSLTSASTIQIPHYKVAEIQEHINQLVIDDSITGNSKAAPFIHDGQARIISFYYHGKKMRLSSNNTDGIPSQIRQLSEELLQFIAGLQAK